METSKTLTILFGLNFILGLSAWAADSTCEDEGHYPLVTKAELKEMVQAKKAFIVDVNSKESFAKVHVPGAIHYEAHRAEFAKMLPKDKDAVIVSYCGGPACMAWKSAAEEACKLGYKNIRHFKDGISGWAKGT